MCRPASFVVTRDHVFWSLAAESHEQIISEHKLHADGAGEANIVRVEISPANNNYRLPLDQWVYVLDEDQPPSWYYAADVESRVRAVLPEWLAAKVVLSGQTIEKVDRQIVAVSGGTIQSVYGGTIQYVSGGTIQSVYGGTIITHTALSPSILHSPNAVIVDRSQSPIQCYVGTATEPEGK